MSRVLVVVLAVAPAIAAAEPPPRTRAVVERPASAFAGPPLTGVSQYLYLNRCSGGCTIHGGGTDDARTQNTSIPAAGTYTVGEFANSMGQTGAAADAEWATIVKCVTEVYSPYNITVTDQLPPSESYDEAVIAGQPGDIGRPIDNLGVAPIAANCSAQDDVISFTFANHHPGSGTARLDDICWTAAQESAHGFGLDHEYEFTDGSSTCTDPMTYRVDCGGEKFFRYKRAKCGEDAARTCRCGGTQNSHATLLKVFGPGTPTSAPPVVTITSPATGVTVPGNSVVHANASAQRGVAKVELMLNGSRWAVAAGIGFGPNGQPPADYTLPLPANLPDSILDVKVVATDDLGVSTTSSMITITKGAACTTASTCADQQHCTDGRCAYDPPVGELGDSCEYSQYCKSWECIDTGDAGQRCVTDCEVDEPTSCPATFTCVDAGGGHGFCVIVNTGCCSVGDGRAPWLPIAMSIGVLGFVLRRRRR